MKPAEIAMGLLVAFAASAAVHRNWFGIGALVTGVPQ
tara:strand:- start:9619 stop:9729 length:111 start_codon:yes stop_codon:yes gene_type:complete